MINIILIFSGIIIGIVYFTLFEKFNPNSLTNECWKRLHYMNKINSPLIYVHIKSILAGLILIICALYNYKYIIIFIASSIIGLHISQYYDENKLIKERNLN